MRARTTLIARARNVDPREEGHQALVRLAGAATYLACLTLLWLAGHQALVSPALAPASAYLAFACVWMWSVAMQCFGPQRRRFAAMLLDHGLLAWGLAASGEVFSLVIWAPTFATIGYGLRFGRHHAHVSIVVSSLMLASAMALSEFWLAHWPAAVGFLIGNIALPLYAMRLSGAIAASGRAAELRASALEASAMRDALTGALNRSALSTLLDKKIAQGERGFVMFIDLDDFKRVNDLHGHAAGDELLCRVVSTIQASLRSTDALARIGGDEFAVILGAVSEIDCRQIAHKIIAAISQLANNTARPFGASIGISRFPGPAAERATDIVARADAQMYHAKRSGRNRISIEPTPPSPVDAAPDGEPLAPGTLPAQGA